MKKVRLHASYGFTLVEILVSITLIALISAVVLWNQSEATDSVAMSNAVNEVSIFIREAQVFGVGVRYAGGATTTAFNIPYGIYTELDANYVILFADKDDDNAYDGDSDCDIGPSEECLEKKVLDRVVIDDLCGRNSAGTIECRDDVAQLRALTVTYTRPRPEGTVTFLNPGGNKINSFTNELAQIKMESARGLCEVVTVYGVGQITTTDIC